MDEAFKARVEKLFGANLSRAVPNSSFQSSSWYVLAGEVERREWNRDRGGDDDDRYDAPCAAAYEEGCLKREEGEGDGLDEAEKEERDVRASIGLDPTLDREEEEDVYDRLAMLKETTDERIYMRDVNDHGPYLNYNTAVSELFEDTTGVVDGPGKDPRADHRAANIRLKEDSLSDDVTHTARSSNADVPMVDHENKTTAGEVNLKPILKRKEKQLDVRPKKHVRFDPAFIDDHDKEFKDSLMHEKTMVPTSVAPDNESPSSDDSRQVPDYLKNPSKYVCYSFENSEEVDEQSNRSAFEDFHNMIRKSRPAELVAGSIELPKSVIFTPRKKTSDAMRTDSGSGTSMEDGSKAPVSEMVRSVSIAAGEAQESEACAMEEDGVDEKASTTPRKSNRKYRSKASLDDSAV